jgi:hypothetical protein
VSRRWITAIGYSADRNPRTPHHVTTRAKSREVGFSECGNLSPMSVLGGAVTVSSIPER